MPDCACAEFISKYALTWKYVNMSFWAFYPKIHAYSQEDPQNTNRNTKFVRILVSLKCRNSYLKLISYRSCFECIEISRIWFSWCIVAWLSLTLRCKKNLLSMLRCLQTTTDPYLKTVTISTYDRNFYHTP